MEKANVKTRFSSDNQPKKRGRNKGSTPTDWLRKLSHTNIRFDNPLTGKNEMGEVNLVVAIQLILKATQDSDLASIKEYFDRIDGKVKDIIIDQSQHTHFTNINIKELEKKEDREILELAIGRKNANP